MNLHQKVTNTPMQRW